MYQACIFDFDGTLADTLDSIVYFGNSALAECGYPAIDREKYRYLVGKGSDLLMRGMLQEVAPKGYTEDDVMLLRRIYENLYEHDPMHFVDQYEGMEALLNELKAKGIKLAVLSNKPHNITERLVTMLFSSDLFDVCYGQRFNVERKPSPEGALGIAKELGLQAKDCLYIGDSNIDMQTGEAAGMDTVGVLWGFRCRAELEQSHAKHIVRSPQEILKIALGNTEKN
ncbi:HAD family hydrolase [Clostridium minihomine]|uniref:HAD family hydrolase n=1 Tax=Clostridium minihomine TaxID=2045012 RepID=UPI000C794452|nr:HAD family hydrolase [Clostridium minihomine]